MENNCIISIFTGHTYQKERKNEENSLQTQEFCQKGPCGRLILIMISWLEGNEVGLLPAQSIAWFSSSELASVGDFISSH